MASCEAGIIVPMHSEGNRIREVHHIPKVTQQGRGTAGNGVQNDLDPREPFNGHPALWSRSVVALFHTSQLGGVRGPPFQSPQNAVGTVALVELTVQDAATGDILEPWPWGAVSRVLILAAHCLCCLGQIS